MVVAPVISLYVSTGHEVQESTCASSLYLPFAQGVQTPEDSSYSCPNPHCMHPPCPSSGNPSLHVQSSIEVLPLLDSLFVGQLKHCNTEVRPVVFPNFPAGHSRQSALPISALNSPFSHLLQGPPSGPVYPGLHLQSDWLSLSMSVVVSPVEQDVHISFSRLVL